MEKKIAFSVAGQGGEAKIKDNGAKEKKEEAKEEKNSGRGNKKQGWEKKNYAIIAEKRRAISRQRAFAATGPVGGSFSPALTTLPAMTAREKQEAGKRNGGRARVSGAKARREQENEKKKNEKKASSEQLGNRQESRVIVWR